MKVKELIRKLSNLNDIEDYEVNICHDLLTYSYALNTIVVFDDEKIILLHD